MRALGEEDEVEVAKKGAGGVEEAPTCEEVEAMGTTGGMKWEWGMENSLNGMGDGGWNVKELIWEVGGEGREGSVGKENGGEGKEGEEKNVETKYSAAGTASRHSTVDWNTWGALVTSNSNGNCSIIVRDN